MVRRLLIICVAIGLACGDRSAELTLDARAREVLREAARSPQAWVRAETVRLLAETDGRVERELVRAGLDDSSPLVQTAAVEALLRLGDPAVEETAMTRLVAGTEIQRAQILETIVNIARPSFREQCVRRAMLDVSPGVQVAALEHAATLALAVTASDVGRLVSHENLDVADAAFRALVQSDAPAAMDLMLAGLREPDQVARKRALRLSQFLPSANLWPMMRSLASSTDSDIQRLALLGLGNLGDPTAEDALRNVLLTAEAREAAEALRALSAIPTARARDQALVHRRDPRPAVRRAALDVLVAQTRPTDDFEPFLTDGDPEIAKAALLHMQHADPGRAASLFERSLADADDPGVVLVALLRASSGSDVRPFLEASAPRLRALLGHEDPGVAGAAARLLLLACPPAPLLDAIRAARGVDALYALLEAGIGREAAFGSLYVDALDSELTMLRVVGAIGVLSGGLAEAPPAS